MVSEFSPSLRLELPATGDQSGTWGVTANRNIGTLLEAAIAGGGSDAIIHDDTADYVLSVNDGAVDEARRAVLRIEGAITADRNVVCADVSKVYILDNRTTGGFSITLKTAGGLGVAVPNGRSRLLYCDATDVRDAVSAFGANVVSLTENVIGVLPLANGGTGSATAAGARTNLGLGALAVLDTVGVAQIDADSITNAKMADDAIGTPELLNNAVTTDKVADAMVTTVKIANEAVTAAKLAPDAFEFRAGDIKPTFATSQTGWLMLNGDTIGSAASGADQASADLGTLYTVLWDNLADAQAPVTGGRGASAAADFAADKPLQMPDGRGRSLLGSGQGNTAEGGGAGTDRTLGETLGAETHTLTVDELAAHIHSAATVSGSTEGGSGDPQVRSGNTGSTGGDQPHNNMQPNLVVNWLIKT